MPAAGALTSNTLTIESEAGIAVQAHDPAWSEAEPAQGEAAANGRNAHQFSAAQGATEITLTVGREDRRGKSDTVIDRAWVQTWLTGAGRQDRAVYRFSGAEQPLEISLPPGVSAGNVEARLDGQSVPIVATSEQTLAVRFDPRGGREHVLELHYQFDGEFARLGTIEAQLPRFSSNVWMQRMYWQLILPGDQHLISGGGEVTPEFSWVWSGMYWARRAPLDQAELEEWSGAQRETPPPEKANRYLFSVAGNPERLMARTVERGQIVLIASLAVLCVGLLLIYLPVMRRPVTLLAGGVLLLAVAAWNADLALLLAQASVLGVALVLLSGYLEQTISRRRTGAVVVRSGSSIIKRSSAQIPIRALEAAAAASSSGGSDVGEETANESEMD